MKKRTLHIPKKMDKQIILCKKRLLKSNGIFVVYRVHISVYMYSANISGLLHEDILILIFFS